MLMNCHSGLVWGHALMVLTCLARVTPGKNCGDNEYKDENGWCKSCKLLCDPAYNTVAQCQHMCPEFFSTLEPSAGRLPIIFALVVVVVMLSLLVALLCWFRHSISSYLRSKRCWQARCWWGTKPQQETNLVEQIVDDTQSDSVPVVPSAQRGDLMSTFPHSITI